MAPSAIPSSLAPRSRRATLCGAGALAAFASGLCAVFAQRSTPVAESADAGPIYIQTFASGNLFKTQGSDPDLPPYTLYLRGAAERTLFFADQPERVIGVVPTDRFVDALAASDTQTAVLIAPPTDTSGAAEEPESVWVLALSFWETGEDPGELTYQGSVVPPAEAEERFGVRVAAEPTWQNIAAGYFFHFGLPTPSSADSEGLRLVLG